MANIEVILTCADCGAKSDPIPAGRVDRYQYHDAPSNGVTINPSRGWYADAQEGFVLCPGHYSRERVNAEREMRWQAQRQRIYKNFA